MLAFDCRYPLAIAIALLLAACTSATPQPPVAILSTAGDGFVRVSWEPVLDAREYLILRDTAGAGAHEMVRVQGETTL